MYDITILHTGIKQLGIILTKPYNISWWPMQYRIQKGTTVLEYHTHHKYVPPLYLGVAFLIKVNIVVEQFYKELYLSWWIHALIGDSHTLLQALQHSLFITQLVVKRVALFRCC